MQLLRLLHLASPALPIGGFHFSQGLEYAVSRGWVFDETSASEWINGIARRCIGRLDLPVMCRLHLRFERDDREAVKRWNAHLIAARETAELRAEDEHMGRALAKVLLEHQLSFAAEAIERPSYATVFAFACQRWGVSVTDSLTAYAWAWAETQALAAVKLVPLGQSSGQRILHRLTQALPRVIADAQRIFDSHIGLGALMQGIASARHESQYTRLFRS